MSPSVNIVNKGTGLNNWLYHHFIIKKMMTPVGYLLLALVGILIAYVSAYINYHLVFYIAAGFIGLVLAVVCILHPYFGFYSSIIVSTLIFTPERLFGISLPFGIGVEVYTYFTLLGVLTKGYAKQEIQREFWSHPVTIGLIILLAFYSLEAVNPSMQSMVGWSNYYRKFLSFLAFYFISYCLLNSKESIRFFLRFWLFFTPLLALYACKQQWFGLFNWELQWILAD